MLASKCRQKEWRAINDWYLAHHVNFNRKRMLCSAFLHFFAMIDGTRRQALCPGYLDLVGSARNGNGV